MKPARKLVSGRVTLEEFTELRNYAARQGLTQDAIIAQLVRALLNAIRPRDHTFIDPSNSHFPIPAIQGAGAFTSFST